MAKCAKCGKSFFLKWWDMPDGTRICFSCHDKEEINQLLKTTEGKGRINLRVSTFFSTGILLIVVGLVIMNFFSINSWIPSFVLIGMGISSIYKGFSYKRKSGS